MTRRSIHLVGGLSACVLAGVAALANDAPSATPTTVPEKVGYAVGYDLGRVALEQIQTDGVEVDIASFLRGIGDAMLSNDVRMSDAELYATLADLERDVNERAANERLKRDPAFSVVNEANAQRSREFHASFAEKEGAVTLESGAQYRVLESGDGRSPTVEDTVELTYQGRTLGGGEIGEGGRVEIAIREMTRGGREVVPLMREGDRWLVAIPPRLAYGVAGKPPEIGPSETLVFELTLERVVSE